MAKALSKTRSQAFWPTTRGLVERALAALRAVETYGQQETRALAERVRVDADRLALEQPRHAKVSRLELEDHAALHHRDAIRDEMRASARPTRRGLETSLNELRAALEQQKRTVRQPKRPDGGVTEVEKLGLSSLAESRAIRSQLEELNARFELGNADASELLTIAADPDAGEARRFVAETTAARVLARPLVHPEPPPHVNEPTVLARHMQACREIDETRAAHVAQLEAITEARVPAHVRERESATAAIVAAIERRWSQVATRFTLCVERVHAMPDPLPADEAAVAELSAAHTALVAAVEDETRAEAAEG